MATQRTTRRIAHGALSIAFWLLATAPLAAETYVDTFETGSSQGAWTFGLPPVYPMSGGNPGRYLRVDNLDTFAPQPRCAMTSNPFTGNYRERHVVRIAVDLVTFDVDFSAAERPCTLMLVNNNATVGNTNDDWAVYYKGVDIPQEGQGWKSISFDIPAQERTLPAGWNTFQFGSGSPTPNWNVAIQDVDRVLFFYGDPEFFFIFQQWDLGLDNVLIETAPANPFDLDRDGSVGPTDLAILLGAWGTTGPGDFNGDGTVGASDLAELLGAWG
ncbi:MAG: hypothetical protein JNL80_01105 [Phycisphaerae bacterium]|jgi:hypothetical protein|nr:hypothetical protein [Phycisphaerae bacterium]